MSNLENSIKKIGYDFSCKNLTESHDLVTNFFLYPNEKDIIAKINSMTDEFDKVQFMEKFKGIISEDSIVESEKEIKENLMKIKEYMHIDTKNIYALHILYDYLMELNRLHKYDPSKKHCNIIDIYIDYSNIIHLMLLIASPIFHDIQEKKRPLFSKKILFNRCYYTTQSFFYLIGERTTIEHVLPSPTKRPFQGQPYKHVQMPVDNADTLTNVINDSVAIPMYYLHIEINNETFDHTFIIVKYNDGQNPNYIIIQSYAGEYFPIKKNYSQKEIIQMVRDFSSIFYDDYGPLLEDSLITNDDRETWKKYFFVDLQKDFPELFNMEKGCGMDDCLTYVFGIIDEQLCYLSINELIKKSEHTINSYLNELLFPLAKKMNIDMKSFNSMIPIHKHMVLRKESKKIYITDIHSKIKLDWNDIKKTIYAGMPMETTLFKIYKIKNLEEFFSFLSLLEKFVELKHVVNMSSICHPNVDHQGGNDDPTYKDKYLKYKYKYLSMKGSGNITHNET